MLNNQRILDINSASNVLEEIKQNDKKIVFTNGCFDILHRGHAFYLEAAANHGDILIVGVNSDSSVKRLKGEDRPINDEQSRAYLLASLRSVDYVIIFDEDTPYNLIKLVMPNILIKGGDYSIENIVGADIVTANGGYVKTIDFVEGFSTTNTIEKMAK